MDRNKKKAVAHKAFDAVALRKESVDRNVALDVALVPVEQVALRKESVDRNRRLFHLRQRGSSRSPQGERGEKYPLPRFGGKC